MRSSITHQTYVSFTHDLFVLTRELSAGIRRSTCGTYSWVVSLASIRVSDKDDTQFAAVLEALTATLWSVAAKVHDPAVPLPF